MAKSGSDRQLEHRTKMKRLGLKRKEIWVREEDLKGIAVLNIDDLRAKWQAENNQNLYFQMAAEKNLIIAEWKEKHLKEWEKDKIDEAKKSLRKGDQHKYYQRGYVAGILAVCQFMVSKQWHHIAKMIVKEHYIDRTKCRENVIDKMTMDILEKAEIFGE